MSSGAEPEDLDLGCSGKTNAGSPGKKSILFLQFSKFMLRKYSNISQSVVFASAIRNGAPALCNTIIFCDPAEGQ